ncbi:MAG: hypothetical protein HYV60_05025, partial [Planctomycetia bacterium]|nr:hypothetical protein [Planctomycetia bacterium]
WNSNTGELVATMKRHKYFVQSLAFSIDGSWLAAGGADGTVRFWNLVQRREEMAMQRTRITNRRLFFEQLEDRWLLAVQAARMELLHQLLCDPEADNARITAVDTAEVASQTRHFSLVAYDTGHPAGSTFESDAVFGQGDCRAVPSGPGGTPATVRVWRFPEHALEIQTFTVPNSLVEPMQVEVNTAGRVALARYVTSNDVRQFVTWTSDSYIRVTTLPDAVVNNNLVDDDFGLSAAIGPLTEFTTEFDEKRLLGQIKKSTITPSSLPMIVLAFSTGSAELCLATISQEVTRIDITANYPDLRRVVVIGANPFTEDFRQTRDVLSDFDSAIIETVGADGRLYVDSAVEVAGALPILENVARVSLFQSEKSTHNPRDPSFVILLGNDIPTDGFGDVALVEAEDGDFDSESQKRGRAHASGNGEFAHETVFLNGETLSGTIPVDQAGEAIPFFRHSLDNAVGSVAPFTVASAGLNVELSPTSDATTTIAAGWDIFRNDFVQSIVAAGESTAYSIGPTRAEIDTVGLVPIGAPLGAGRLDVNADGAIVAVDVLIVINFLNESGPMVAELGARRDTNRDGYISPVDVLLIINHINSSPSGEGEATFANVSAAGMTIATMLAPGRIPELLKPSIAVDEVYAAAAAHFADRRNAPMLVADASELEESLLDQLAIDVASMLAG